MKKHDEGYVLAYVTVVLLVFCLVATTILTGAMKNLEHQQQAQAKMEDKYFAKGMIEKALVELEHTQGIKGYAKEAPAETQEEDSLRLPEQLLLQLDKVEDAKETADNGIYLTITAQKGVATVTYILKLNATEASVDEQVLVVQGYGGYVFVSSLPEREVP